MVELGTTKLSAYVKVSNQVNNHKLLHQSGTKKLSIYLRISDEINTDNLSDQEITLKLTQQHNDSLTSRIEYSELTEQYGSTGILE